ncbi:hypothetical protein [Pseudoalteromonas tetraodonis]|uniref:hypothetical protein n=1 Tax=Pseudoalteromonas tetraodonis TaxID=43659 RepID=UPI003CFE9C86
MHDIEKYRIGLDDFEKIVAMAEESSSRLEIIKKELTRLKFKRFTCILVGYVLIISIFLVAYLGLVDFNSVSAPILTALSISVSGLSIFTYYYFVKKETNQLLDDLSIEVDSLRELLDIIHDIENNHVLNQKEKHIALVMLKIRIRRLRFAA